MPRTALSTAQLLSHSTLTTTVLERRCGRMPILQVNKLRHREQVSQSGSGKGRLGQLTRSLVLQPDLLGSLGCPACGTQLQALTIHPHYSIGGAGSITLYLARMSPEHREAGGHHQKEAPWASRPRAPSLVTITAWQRQLRTAVVPLYLLHFQARLFRLLKGLSAVLACLCTKWVQNGSEVLGATWFLSCHT